MTPPPIEFASVTKRYRGVRGTEVLAVSDITLRVDGGQVAVLIGPSGCGKSTLLRLAAGLEAPTSGQVRIGGSVVTGPRSNVGLVFQRPVLLPWRTARANVLLPAVIRGKPAGKATARADALLDKVGLSGFEDAYPAELSGGMQARVALARAMSQDPALLLMDEPFASLDAITREDIAALVLQLWTERQQTVLFVTHSIDEAILLADQIFVMSPRPGSIVRSVEIALPRPRTMGQLLHPDAVRVADAIRSALRPAGKQPDDL
jgi:NitT/TauT family transport system ATP-binding protein